MMYLGLGLGLGLGSLASALSRSPASDMRTMCWKAGLTAGSSYMRLSKPRERHSSTGSSMKTTSSRPSNRFFRCSITVDLPTPMLPSMATTRGRRDEGTDDRVSLSGT